MLLNVGGVIDTSVLCSIPGVHAILLISQAGNITGDVVADVILGKHTLRKTDHYLGKGL